MDYFDYQSVAAQAKIPPQKLAELERRVRDEFPHDPMMFELHVLRACMAIRDKHLSLEEALTKSSALAA